MTFKNVRCTLRSLLLVAMIAGLSAGCRVIGGGVIGSRHQANTVRPGGPMPEEPIASREETGSSEQKMLAAVEKFLERTADYESAGEAGTHADPVKNGGVAGDRSRFALAEDVSTAPTAGGAGTGAYPPPEPAGVVTNARVSLGETIVQRSRLAIPTLRSLTIRKVSDTTGTVQAPEKLSATNEPLDMEPGADPEIEDRFIERLERQAREADDFDSQWRLNLVLLALNRITSPPESAGSLTAEAKSILDVITRLVLFARTAARNPLLVGPEALDTVDELRLLLADRVEPEVMTVALCRKVVTFGVYEEMEENEFVAGRTVNTIVYSEIRNLRAEETPDHRYKTRLATRLEMFTPDGNSVWKHEEPQIEDVCRRRRTDFFVAQRIKLPPTIPAGEYVLKVFAEDLISGMASEASHPVTVYSPLSVAING